jgi:TolB protein
MKKILPLAILALPTTLISLTLAVAFGAAQPPPSADTLLRGLHDLREVHIKNVKQLTFEGQNAEAYWSFSGKKIVFQSMSGDMKADQIYTMNPDGSDKKMVSTGTGRTTCSYFLKGSKKAIDGEIIFASTHGYSPATPPEPDRSLGYVWPIYPYFGIYKASADGTNIRPLFPKTITPGTEIAYNAEATVSRDGKRIIFTSTKDGDLELYTMKSDGADVKRVTNRVGYDGGAYFSPNGKQIVWRASVLATDADVADYQRLLKLGLVRPSKMELWIANSDGSKAKQITSNGAANFAPFFTPDGKQILFASNVDDPKRRKFELYKINTDGTNLERVTYGGEFDSFPMFSPDGKKLLWASNRNGAQPHDTNIFVADWVN